MFYIFLEHKDIIKNSTLNWQIINRSDFYVPNDVIGLISSHNLTDPNLDQKSIIADLFLLKQKPDQIVISDFNELVDVELNEFESKFNLNENNWIKVAQKLTRNTTNKLFITPTKKLVLVPIFTQRASVHILAQTETGKFLIVKQYRPGPEKILTNIPGGGMEEGENPIEAGLRELLEETGYTGNVKHSHTCFSGAYHSMLKHTLVVTDCKKIAELENDDEENFGVLEVTETELLEIVKIGNITLSDFATIMFGLAMLK